MNVGVKHQSSDGDLTVTFNSNSSRRRRPYTSFKVYEYAIVVSNNPTAKLTVEPTVARQPESSILL